MYSRMKLLGSLLAVCGLAAVAAGTAQAADPAVAATGMPISNDCSGGNVYFTFDDGPSENTAALLRTLQALNLKATFFVMGQNVGDTFDLGGSNRITGTTLVQQEVAAGHTLGNHSWDHRSITGQSTSTATMSDSDFQSELTRTSQAIVNAGAPTPTLYRPPYGDINGYYDLMARNMGYRVVMSYGTASDSSAGDGNIIDSDDYNSAQTASSIANRIINGYHKSWTNPTTGVTTTNYWHGIQRDSILSFHDGIGPEAQNAVDALPLIVNYMNQRHLCSSATIRSDATGNIVPLPPPAVPTTGNLVSNPSLEARPGNAPVGSNSSPTCWQQGGYGTHSKAWSLTSDAHSGGIAESLTISNWVNGDGKLVMTQRQSEASACLASVAPGK